MIPWVLALLSACGAEEPPSAAPPREPARLCDVPDGTSGRPTTPEEVVDHINGLPRPVTVPCLLASLRRPLELYASINSFSAQPDFGRPNPRVFLFFDDLIVSVVPVGPGRPLVEMSVVRDPRFSLKAELELPITDDVLDRAEPYEHILYESGAPGTRCSACHLGEYPDPTVAIAPAYTSGLEVPDPVHRVPLWELMAEQAACDPAVEPDRCAVLDALLAHGEVVDRDVFLAAPPP